VGAAEASVGLLSDAEDIAVTRWTAEDLTRVGTVAAMWLIALVGSGSAPDIAAVCGQLAYSPEEAVRRGALEARAWADDARC